MPQDENTYPWSTGESSLYLTQFENMNTSVEEPPLQISQRGEIDSWPVNVPSLQVPQYVDANAWMSEFTNFL